MVKKIFLFSSQLAAFIGRNPHTNASKIFNQLYERYYKEKAGMEIREKNIGDGDKLRKIGEKIGDKNLLKKVGDICSRNLSTMNLQKERMELITKLEKDGRLDEDDKKEIKKTLEGYTNKRFGTIREGDAVEIYKEKFECEVITKINGREKKILELGDTELWLKSRLDGMRTDGTVVEIKNRIYKIFEEVKEYEWIQVQAYLRVYGLKDAHLVEYLKNGTGEMKMNHIERDDRYWEEVMEGEMRDYLGVFLRIIRNEKRFTKYKSLSENEQNEYIKKMLRKKIMVK